MKKGRKITFFAVVIVIVAISALAVFGLKLSDMGLDTNKFDIKGVRDIRLGIDIRGGVEAVFVPKDLDRAPTDEELDAVRTVLDTRLDAANILDREVTVDKGNGEVWVRFPWKSDETEFDPESAINELGETALLTFRDEENKVLLEGKHVKRSSPAAADASMSQKGRYLVQLELTSEGAKLFEAATEAAVGKRIAIYMDEILISNPTVEQKISGGSAVITGMETMKDAKDLSDKINSGSLPFSLETKNFSTISPSLGQDALKYMIQAGIVAFILISLFMLLYYRIPGFVACIGLFLQMALLLLVISVPQITLTLPGIAGFILSLGMQLDANIITAERIKEELNQGCTILRAVNLGYHRAFSAVLDGNLTIIFISLIMMFFGSGALLSFAYTLIAGALLNFVCGVLASRLMQVSLTSYPLFSKKFLYGGKKNV